MKKQINKFFNKEKEINLKIKEMEQIMSSDIDFKKKRAEIRLILEVLKKDLLETHMNSLTDDTTGLLTKKYCKLAFNKIAKETKCKDHYLSLLVLDIDRLKEVNDTFGHDAGTTVIIQVANAISKCIRLSDVACRYGGDEFVIISVNNTVNGVEKIINRIQKNVKELKIGGSQRVTISIGYVQCAMNDINECSYAEMFKKADEMLYKEKNEKNIQVD